MTPALRTLFLDAGGVLVHPNWVRASEVLTRHGTPVTAAQLATADPQARRDIDDATLIQRTDDRTRGWRYFDLVLAHAGVTPSDATDRAIAELQAYHRVHNVWEHLPADVVPSLGRLRARGLQLVVVSNANGRLGVMLDRIGLRPHVDVVLDSFDWGVEKPDPRLFQLALAHAGATAATTVHVGDLYHVDIAGARAAGLAGAVLFDAAGLYPEADCPRVRGWTELEALISGW